MHKNPLHRRLLSLSLVMCFLVVRVWSCSSPAPVQALGVPADSGWVTKDIGTTGRAVTLPDGEGVLSNYDQLVTVFNELVQSDMTPLNLARVSTDFKLSKYWTKIETGAGTVIYTTDLARGISASGTPRQDLVMATYGLLRVTGLNSLTDKEAAKEAKAKMLSIRGREFSQEFSPDSPTANVYDIKVVSLNVLTGEKIGSGEKTLATYNWPVFSRISMNYAGQWAVVFVPPSDPNLPQRGEVWASLGTSAGVLQVAPVRIWAGDPQISEGAVALDVVSDQVALLTTDSESSKLRFCTINRPDNLECGGRLVRPMDLGLDNTWSFTSVTVFENPNLGMSAVMTAKTGNHCEAFLVTDYVTYIPVNLGEVACGDGHTHVSGASFTTGNTLVVVEADPGISYTEVSKDGVPVEIGTISAAGEYPIARVLDKQFCITYVEVVGVDSLWRMACKDPVSNHPTATPSPTPTDEPTNMPTMTATPTSTETTVPVMTSTRTLTPTKTQKPPTVTKTPSPTRTASPTKTPTITRTPTRTKTPTRTPTRTPTPTNTPRDWTPEPTVTPAFQQFLPLAMQLG